MLKRLFPGLQCGRENAQVSVIHHQMIAKNKIAVGLKDDDDDYILVNQSVSF